MRVDAGGLEQFQLLRAQPVASSSLRCLQLQERAHGVLLRGEKHAAHLSGLSDPTPFPLKRPFAEQGGKDSQAVETGEVLRGIALFEIALHLARRIPSSPFPPVPTTWDDACQRAGTARTFVPAMHQQILSQGIPSLSRSRRPPQEQFFRYHCASWQLPICEQVRRGLQE